MAKYNYILSHNPLSDLANQAKLQVFISKNRDIETWYLSFPGTYIIKSDKALSELLEQFNPFFAGDSYLLTWLPRGHASGLMPPTVWQWLDNNNQPFLPKPNA